MGTQRAVVVVGAGPAGIAAAMASAATAQTILLDERTAPGGRERWPDHTTEFARMLARSGVDYRPGTVVWGIFPGPVVAAYDDTRAMSIDASAVVIATGAVDRTWPVPGWHLDGVLTSSELSSAMRDGSLDSDLRYGLIGFGDTMAATIRTIESVGGRIAATFQTLEGVRIEGETVVERLCRATGCVDVDRVVIALGRRPDPALALQARAASVFDRNRLIDMPLLAANGATSLPGVFVTGEAAGRISLAEVRNHGVVTGTAAAAVANGAGQSSELQPVSSTARERWPIPVEPATVLCREQGVTLGTVRSALDAGARDVNDLRRRTRAGMGSSGGGDVLPVLAALLMEAEPTISDDRLTGRHRPPARPLPFNVVLNTPGDTHR